MAKPDNKVKQEDLGFLFDQTKLTVIPLPKGNTGVIVNYDAIHFEDYESIEDAAAEAEGSERGVRISFTMPSVKREITLSREETSSKKRLIKIKCPALIFSSYYADLPHLVGRYIDHSIFIHNRKNKAKIEACPYLVSNVGHLGGICFGSMRMPLSPKEAFNIFWESPFNSHLMEVPGDLIDDSYYDLTLKDYIKEYHKKGIKAQNWEDYTPLICGKKFWASPFGGDVILISSSKKLLTKIPQKYWRKFKDSPLVIALGFHRENHWEFVSGNFKFSLEEGFVTNSHSTSKTIELKKQYQEI